VPQLRGKTKQQKVDGKQTLHVGLSRDLKEKLDQMAAVDERELAEFMRRLIAKEWDRRQAAAAPAA
jgi:predicted transcriptional regulator